MMVTLKNEKVDNKIVNESPVYSLLQLNFSTFNGNLIKSITSKKTQRYGFETTKFILIKINTFFYFNFILNEYLNKIKCLIIVMER